MQLQLHIPLLQMPMPNLFWNAHWAVQRNWHCAPSHIGGDTQVPPMQVWPPAQSALLQHCEAQMQEAPLFT